MQILIELQSPRDLSTAHCLLSTLKHLKIKHPTEKTLLKDSSSKKTNQENENYNNVEMKDVEKLYKLVDQNSKSDHQEDIYFNSTVGVTGCVDVKVGR